MMSQVSESTKDYQVLAASVKEFDDTVPEGYIISQTPEAGNDMAEGDGDCSCS